MLGPKVLRAPVAISGSVSSKECDELRVTAGRVRAQGKDRYLEFALPAANLIVRASWTPKVSKGGKNAKGGSRDGDLPMLLSINESAPVDVVARKGALYEVRGSKVSTKPFQDERLKELGRALLGIKLRNTLDFHAIQPPSVKGDPDATARGFGDWLSCMADTTGAGAGIGGAAGGVAGGIPGATTGAVVGGALGGSFGLGYCTTRGLLEWLFD